ncbi:MAG: 3'-5' exonuclease [Candidatus Omnitrophica bacterium]|nr:3'-5' exonuclease [Candidatus Omnitrophota bacterium]
MSAGAEAITPALKIARPLVVLDLETTGTWLEKDRIVEIALVRLEPDGERRSFLSRVNPGMPIPPRVSQITGITDADVKDAPPFKKIAAEVAAFIGEADLGGFNVERFDLVILERELFGAGLKFDWRGRVIYDAQKIYHIHEKRDLKAAYQFYCGKDLVNGHTAMGDTEAALEILGAQVRKYGAPEQGIESLRDFEYERIDDYFDAEKKFRWWNGELYPVFGKYARKVSLREIAGKDPGYLEWLLSTDFGDPVKGLIRNALAGRFPPAPASRA